MVQVSIIFFFIILKVVLNGTFSDQAQRKVLISAMAIVFILQSGLRHVSMGADTLSYRYLFERAELVSWSEVLCGVFSFWKQEDVIDPLYTIFTKVFQIFSTDYQAYLFFVALCFFIPFAVWVYRNTKTAQDILFAIVLYQGIFFAFFSITGARQTLASAILLIGYEFVRKRQLLYFAGISFPALLMHKSSAVFLPFYVLSRLRNVSLILGGAFIAFPVLFLLKGQFALLLGRLSGSERYLSYAENTGFESPVNFTILYFAMCVFCAFMSKMTTKETPEARPYFIALAIGLVFLPLVWVNPNFMRVVQYYSIFLLLALPSIATAWGARAQGMGKVLFWASTALIVGFTLSRGGTFFFMWDDVPGFYE